MCLEVSAKDFGGVSHDGLAVAEEYFNLYMTVIAFQLDGVCTVECRSKCHSVWLMI